MRRAKKVNKKFEFDMAEIPLLREMPEELQQYMESRVEVVNLSKNDYVFREGEDAEYISIILDGQVKLSRFDAEGRENIIMILYSHDTIWESMFLENSTFPYSAVALTDVTFCKIYNNDFSRVLKNPNAAMRIVLLLSRKLHDANVRNVLLATRDPKARVAGFLLYRRDRSSDNVIELRLEDIAASIGLRLETVSRKLGELQDDMIIERAGRGKLKIVDYDGLREIYESNN
ncbi:MAG: Crp/Fnr family transcriptional regulator [Butyrivibrio sp.]|nr:Crp/Fnr family transcriptional regulator [Butyrivibrio sp.]